MDARNTSASPTMTGRPHNGDPDGHSRCDSISIGSPPLPNLYVCVRTRRHDYLRADAMY